MFSTGFYIIGNLRGYHCQTFTHKETGESRERHTMGIQLETPNKYGGVDTDTLDVRIDETRANASLIKMIEQLKDKRVIVSVSPKEWAFDNNRKGIVYNFGEHSTIEEV